MPKNESLITRLDKNVAGNKYPNERLMMEALAYLVKASNIIVFLLLLIAGVIVLLLGWRLAGLVFAQVYHPLV